MVRGEGAGGGGAAASACAGVISAVGLTVVTVSGGSAGTTGAGAAAGADVTGAAEVVGAPDVAVADTEPLSPPPRMMPVVPMATNRIAPAIPAIHIQRRSMRASS